MMTKKQHQSLLTSALITLGCLPLRDEEDLKTFEVIHKDVEQMRKDMHVDVNKISMVMNEK